MNKDKQLKDASIRLKVEVIRKTNLDFIINYLNTQKPELQTILEIGTGCGYSAYQFSKLAQINQIVSLEKDNERFNTAQSMLHDINKIKLIHTNAFTYVPDKLFDIIFIDGPKKNLSEYVDKFLTFVKKHGIVIIDNLYLNDIRQKFKQTQASRLVGLIEASNNLQLKLKSLDKKRYNLIIDSSGDGLAIIEVL